MVNTDKLQYYNVSWPHDYGQVINLMEEIDTQIKNPYHFW